MGLQKLQEQTMQQISIQSKYLGCRISRLQEISTPRYSLAGTRNLVLICHWKERVPHIWHYKLILNWIRYKARRFSIYSSQSIFVHGWCNI